MPLELEETARAMSAGSASPAPSTSPWSLWRKPWASPTVTLVSKVPPWYHIATPVTPGSRRGSSGDEVRLPQKAITHGDGLCVSIACASIVAKVTRDHLMVEFDGVYPGYGFRKHKGYGTPEHFDCLQRLGPCPIHRRSFQPVKSMV